MVQGKNDCRDVVGKTVVGAGEAYTTIPTFRDDADATTAGSYTASASDSGLGPGWLVGQTRITRSISSENRCDPRISVGQAAPDSLPTSASAGGFAPPCRTAAQDDARGFGPEFRAAWGDSSKTIDFERLAGDWLEILSARMRRRFRWPTFGA